MRLAIVFTLFIGGMLLLPTPALPLGLLMGWGAWKVHQGVTVGGEANFMAALMVAGGLGAAVLTISGLLAWVRTLL